MAEKQCDKRDEVLLCCASGEGTHQFKVVADEAGVMAFLEEMCGGEQDGTMTHSLAHYRDEDNWSNGGTAYNVKLYCAEFSVWKVLPGELAFTPSHVGQNCAFCGKSYSEPSGAPTHPMGCRDDHSAPSTTPRIATDTLSEIQFGLALLANEDGENLGKPEWLTSVKKWAHDMQVALEETTPSAIRRSEPTIQLVRQAIFHVLDDREWDFENDEQRVDFADAVATWIPTERT